MKNQYFKELFPEKQWEIVKAVIISKNHHRLADMIKDGYKITAEMLELLYRVSGEDAVFSLGWSYIKDESIVQNNDWRLMKRYLDKDHERFLSRIYKKNKAKKERKKNSRDRRRFYQLMQENEPSSELMDIALKRKWHLEVIDKFGLVPVYEKSNEMSKDRNKNVFLRWFDRDFLYSMGDFRLLEYDTLIDDLFGDEEDGFSDAMQLTDETMAEIASYKGGLEALASDENEKMDAWLIKNGHGDLLGDDTCAAYRVNNAIKPDDFENWKKLFQANPSVVKQMLKRSKLSRGYLFSKSCFCRFLAKRGAVETAFAIYAGKLKQK